MRREGGRHRQHLRTRLTAEEHKKRSNQSKLERFATDAGSNQIAGTNTMGPGRDGEGISWCALRAGGILKGSSGIPESLRGRLTSLL